MEYNLSDFCLDYFGEEGERWKLVLLLLLLLLYDQVLLAPSIE